MANENSVQCVHCKTQTYCDVNVKRRISNSVRVRCENCDRWFAASADFLESTLEPDYKKTVKLFGVGDDYEETDAGQQLINIKRFGPR